MFIRIIDSVPTAELRPLKNGEIVQTDEAEIGLTYDEVDFKLIIYIF